MFNLEQAIAEWRRQMLAAGIQTPVPLEELESHLREDVLRNIRSGRNEQNAFEIAVRQIGPASPLKGEFQKIEGKFMNRRLIIGIGAIGLLLSITTFLPALAKHKQRNQAVMSLGVKFFDANWAEDERYGLKLSAGFFMVGTGLIIFGLKQRKAQGIMFDLEQAIPEWRQQMLVAGIQSPVPLEELENHLREDVEYLVRTGLSPQHAFEMAAQQLGPARALKHEFTKGKSPMKKILIIITGLFVIAVGMAFVTPAVAHYRDHGMMTAENLGFLSLGITITLFGMATAAWNLKKRRT